MEDKSDSFPAFLTPSLRIISDLVLHLTLHLHTLCSRAPLYFCSHFFSPFFRGEDGSPTLPTEVSQVTQVRFDISLLRFASPTLPTEVSQVTPMQISAGKYQMSKYQDLIFTQISDLIFTQISAG